MHNLLHLLYVICVFMYFMIVCSLSIFHDIKSKINQSFRFILFSQPIYQSSCGFLWYFLPYSEKITTRALLNLHMVSTLNLKTFVYFYHTSKNTYIWMSKCFKMLSYFFMFLIIVVIKMKSNHCFVFSLVKVLNGYIFLLD